MEDAGCHRNVAYCSYAILEEEIEVMIVSDTTADPRFVHNSLVTGPLQVRFYAGAVVRCHGVKLGSLCILDTVPRHDFDQKKKEILADMGEIVSSLLDERRAKTLADADDSANQLAARPEESSARDKSLPA